MHMMRSGRSHNSAAPTPAFYSAVGSAAVKRARAIKGPWRYNSNSAWGGGHLLRSGRSAPSDSGNSRSATPRFGLQQRGDNAAWGGGHLLRSGRAAYARSSSAFNSPWGGAHMLRSGRAVPSPAGIAGDYGAWGGAHHLMRSGRSSWSTNDDDDMRDSNSVDDGNGFRDDLEAMLTGHHDNDEGLPQYYSNDARK